jgi:hypothetical protein
MRRRLDVEPDDLSQLAGELRIVGQLEQTDPMRLQRVRACRLSMLKVLGLWRAPVGRQTRGQ